MTTTAMRKCSLYDPQTDLICDEWDGHDGGMHTPVGMEQRALREADHRRFVARHHDGKRPYESKAEAKRIAKMTTARFGGSPKEPYRCESCRFWHVGEKRDDL